MPNYCEVRLDDKQTHKENNQMPDITIRTQAELDALPASFEEYTRILIQNDPNAGRIIVRSNRGNTSVGAYDNASVVARGNASVKAYDNASVEAYGNASVVAWDNASVSARDNSSVWAWGDASVLAYEQAAIRRYSAESKITLHDSSVCWDMLSSPANISSFAKFSKHINPVIATIPATAKLTADQKNELLAQFKSFLESR
jgi:hypothetical protein